LQYICLEFSCNLMKRTRIPRRKYGQQSALARGAMIGIIVIVIIVIVVGAYVAVSSSSSTTTPSTATTSPPTSVSSSSTPSSSASTSSVVSSSGAVNSSTSAAPVSCPILSTTGAPNTTASSVSLTNSLPSETISEAGSSLLYPLFELWATNFTATYSTIKLDTAAGGSGAGQSGAEKGTLQIGASDAYLSNSLETLYPNVLNIPLAISAQQINYNLPSIPANVHLNFSGPVLAGIYNGSITNWNSSQIRALQSPSVAAMLPDQPIIPLHRSDGSGDTFIFTQYLSFTTPSWSSNVGCGTTVSWPAVPAAQGENGNGGMVTGAEATKYSIAYIGVSYLREAVNGSLGYGYLENQAGNFVNISQTNIQAAANQMLSSTPTDERISLVNAPGANSYPIINYEYGLVLKDQNATGMALSLRTLLSWAISPTGGNSPYFLNQVNFVQLPTTIQTLSQDQINQITGP
jgi:phosphate transport system substrate-binding protein